MLQRRKSITWMLTTSLTVLSICMSFLALSSIPTYAKGNHMVHISINRPTNSTLGSVGVQTSDGGSGFSCISVPQQNRDYDAGSYFIHTGGLQVTLLKYWTGNCQNPVASTENHTLTQPNKLTQNLVS